MRPITTHPGIAALAIALTATVLGGWVIAPSISSMAAAVAASTRCGGSVCSSHIWLRAPAMRRAR
jgi:hypothetical protein